jgi:hypothetical protein
VRRTASKAQRVQPGDVVIIRAELQRGERLGRLFVFARELTEDRFSPYVAGLYNEMASKEPVFHSPLMLRLVEQMPDRELSFVADIDGYVCVQQEVDTAKDKLAKVRIKRNIAPYLDWKPWLQRKLIGIFQWPTKIQT